MSVLSRSQNFIVIDLWFKIFSRCDTCTVTRTNFSVLHPLFASFHTHFFIVRLFLSRSSLSPSLSSLHERPSHPTDKTSSSAPFLTPSPIPCHLYTIFLVIANIHLRRAPSISRYSNPRAHPCTLHPRASVVLPSSAYALSTEARRPLLLIYDSYLQDHAERVKTFYNCATPCVVLLLLGDYAESFCNVSESSAGDRTLARRGRGSRRKSPEAVAENVPRRNNSFCFHATFLLDVPRRLNPQVHITFENIVFIKSFF